MADGKIVSQTEDCTALVDAALPTATALATSGRLREALESLLLVEKRARIASDVASTSRLLVDMVGLCFNAGDWTMLNEYIVLLSKRRGQLKQAMTKMVQKATEFVDKAPSKDIKLKLIDTLRLVTAGKIHVEIERARLTKTLADMKEADGQVAEAADILQELQVETFGSMDRREKVEFILEQMRLGLARKDYIRTQIISKKISTRFFEDPSTDELKRKYYRQMIELAYNDGQYLDVCKHSIALLSTPVVVANPEECAAVVRDAVLFVILAPYSNEQNDLIERVKQEARVKADAAYLAIATAMTTNEVQPWREFQTQFGETLKQSAALSGPDGAKLGDVLRRRVLERNVRVISTYYTRIETARMCALLDMSPQECEDVLSSLVNSKTIFAKIDRPAGVSVFQAPPRSAEVLSDWVANTNALMRLIDKATHVIAKETVVHGTA
eukprot:m.227751 g.227751  ORF g.227751 m.227751 type:complete len:442 (-) comp17310_c0_seq1:309-1634(-)